MASLHERSVGILRGRDVYARMALPRKGWADRFGAGSTFKVRRHGWPLRMAIASNSTGLSSHVDDDALVVLTNHLRRYSNPIGPPTLARQAQPQSLASPTPPTYLTYFAPFNI